VQTVEALAAAYFPATQVAQVEATVAPTTAENVPASQSAQVVLRVSTPARMDMCATHAWTMILMYRAVTGWLKILEVLSVLDHVVGRKKRVVPLAVLAETKFELVSEYCTSISVTNC
jgi:hypothetical protein